MAAPLAEHVNYFNRRSLNLCGKRAGLTAIYFGERSVSFSVDYILFRLAQHQFPGAGFALGIGRRFSKNMTLPIYLGETLAVCQP